MAKETILVTGGTGYIGSHTVVELLQAGYEVIAVDNLANSEISVLDGIEKIAGKRPDFHQIDLCDRAAVAQLFSSEVKPAAIIHFAAHKAVGESVASPLSYYRNNLDSMLNLLEQMAEHQIPNFVFSSSCTVYGNPKKLPVDEASPVIKPESPYGNTKKIGEEILVDATHADKELNVIALRYFNPIGAHSSGHIGELPRNVPSNLMPFITQTAAGIRPQLKVFGNNYNTPDGTCVRDYIHVVDIAKAHVVAVERLLHCKQDENYEVFNLGTGTGNTVLEVIKSFEKSTGERLNYTMVDRRPGDVEKIYASTEKANKVLGWKATQSLDDMTKSAWKWQNNLGKK
jgi:UDP-glucose 4-epimerase